MKKRISAACAFAMAAAFTAVPAQAQGVTFGDNSSQWSNDGECDDPRFEGNGMASTLLDEDTMSDANDCRALYDSGRIRLLTRFVDFGDNSSQWANDGECDDPRFTGRGMAATLLDEDLLSDATDCRRLYQAGDIQLRRSTSWSFGDDSSQWANDGECDDPRFSGDGMAATLLDEDTMRDATDCRILYNSGRIRYTG
jgi:hypothetical protein